MFRGLFIPAFLVLLHPFLTPQMAVPQWSGQGRKPIRKRLVVGGLEAQEVKLIAASLPTDAWTRQTIKEAGKAHWQAILPLCGLSRFGMAYLGRKCGLFCLVAQLTGKSIKYYLSNAPAETNLATFAWVSGIRCPIETCFEEGNQELGLGDYQLGSWTGWHQHMTLRILAHFFLVRLQIRLNDKASGLTLPQAILLLKATLEQPQLDARKAIEIVDYNQRRHHAANLSHRKRRLSNKDVTEVSL